MVRTLLALVAAAGLAAAPAARAADPVVVFAAASLTNAFQEIGKAWQAKGNPEVKFSFAASSALAKQIEQGAPAAVFASADQEWMDYLAARNLVDKATRRTFAANSLVLVVPADRPATVDLSRGASLQQWLGDGRIATGDPDHVPVGKYAKASLTALGAWDAIAPRLVRADNVRAALAFVERGEVAAGIVYSTDAAISSKVKVAGTFPASSHEPITYPVALAAGPAGAAGRPFLDFLATDEAKAIMRKHGFGSP